MLLTVRFLWFHKSGNDSPDSPMQSSFDPQEQCVDLLSTDRPWMRMLLRKRERGQCVPALSGIFKAGDEGLYSSALFNTLQKACGGDIPLDVLHDAFAQELRSRPLPERSAYPLPISRFVSGKRQGVRRSQSVRATKDSRPELSPRAQRYSVDLAERGLSKALSKRSRSNPILISTFNPILPDESAGSSWTQDLRHAHKFEGRTGISVTATELAALSIILGSPLTLAQMQRGSQEKSPQPTSVFGLSISGSPLGDGRYHISLKQHKRSLSQLPAKGSGYSTLYAKHIAAGSLPFSLDSKSISSTLITRETLEAVKLGKCLRTERSSASTSAAQFLSMLPSSRELNFHTFTESTASTSTSLLLRSIAELPFTGGLVPLASMPLVSTVRFVASAGLPPARLLQRLEALVDKVHRHSPNLQLFGPLFESNNAGLLFRERERLGKLATGTVTEESLADKVARMHRYITMLERLMALVPDMKQQDILFAVREATQKEIERSYEDAIAAASLGTNNNSSTEFQVFPAPATSPSKRYSSLSGRRSKRSSVSIASAPSSPCMPVSQETLTSPRSSSTFSVQNLGKDLESVLKTDLPFNIPTIAKVARLVLVAWTQSVQIVAWEDGENGLQFAGLDTLPRKMVMY
ncbi:hypothetical protein CC78DRAFT_575606 [Lojkania enalia]|uniref:Uncharacterized protein n=1 Tax=Lojkania enalia TaxID=147567 RepID=A0A9P4N9F0_9PLEO|nr:hypothetical protein CC78DRAFT_575606 [Didymosphaeria enalia]